MALKAYLILRRRAEHAVSKDARLAVQPPYKPSTAFDTMFFMISLVPP
jgi:hypothetical protein